jgi:hypothetical protein
MNRITEKMLQIRVDHLNKITGSPESPWTRDESGAHSNIGNFHLSHAYGGVSLHRMSNEQGGVSDVFSSGHVPKRELFDKICAFIDGYQLKAS